jgi:2-keto-4-pentenoate hydratase/2-oxohepta-3-ene-1,7-dioic acid hydratase in catechol pathway
MRFLSFRTTEGRHQFAAIDGENAFSLTLPEGPQNLVEFLSQPADVVAAAVRAAFARPPTGILSQMQLLPVIERPGKIVCLGLNYADHAREGGFSVPDYPALFLRVTSTLVGHGEAIIRPRLSELLDYEAELAVVIGKRGRHIRAADALDHVLGYTAFNDASVRDYQRRSGQWTAGKNFDATGALGPILVTPDEVPPGAANLHIECRLNGKVMQSSSTGDMIFDVPRTIEILSEIMTLEPGDVIATGTPPGVGHARTPPVWMRDGDICEIEIEGIGILRNPVRDEAPAMAGAAQ